MQGIAKLLCIWLLVAVLIEPSNGIFGRRRRKCRKGVLRILFRRRCRRPVISLAPTVKTKPSTVKTKPPTVKTQPPTTTRSPIVALEPVGKHKSGLPYCKSRDLNAVLGQNNRRTKRALTWPFECRHASIVSISGEFQFIWPIFDCCSKCDFPAFSECLVKKGSTPDWLCPSEGLHCIVGCVNKHNPNRIQIAGSILPSVVKPDVGEGVKPSITNPDLIKPRPNPVSSRCEQQVKENGTACIRQLCIPLKIKL